MSDRMDVPAGEDGVVRIFAVDLDGAELDAFGRRNGTWPVADALGAEVLAPEQVELFAASDLEGIGLAGYLEDGLGVSASELSGLRARLDALDGGVLIVRSRAFGGRAVTLQPRAPLRHVATVAEARPEVQFEPLPAGGATGIITGPEPSGAPVPKRNWWPLILVIAGLTVGVLALVFS